MAQEYCIYKITHTLTGKCYIGQTQKYKYKNDKPYKYWLEGRWCDHVSTSKKSETPLHSAIHEYGIESFTKEILEIISETQTDEREAYWIKHLNTLVPNGFNVMSHSRCKHRNVSNIANMFLEDAKSIQMKFIKNNGKDKIIYIYIALPEKKKRITFGQLKDSSFEETLKEANEFIKIFEERGIKIIKESLPDNEFQKIRVVRFNKTMVAVYMTAKNGIKTRKCFGGKTITYENAIIRANEFISRIKYEIIENLTQCQQQVATNTDEANSVLD